MLCEYVHIMPESSAEIRATVAEIQKFLKGIAFIGAP